MSLTQALDFVAAGEAIAVPRESSNRFESKNVALRSVPGLPSLDIGIVDTVERRIPNLCDVSRFCERLVLRSVKVHSEGF